MRALHLLIFCLAGAALLVTGCSKSENKTHSEEPPVIEEEPAGDNVADPGADVAPPPPVDPFLSLDAPSDVAAPPANAQKSKSGLAWKVIRKGTGTKKGTENDSVFVHYTSWHPEGKRMSTTRKKDAPKELQIGKAVPGWKESFLDMTEGERRRVWMPAKLAHTRSQRRKKGPRTVDFELVRLVIAPNAPSDLKRPPKTAQKSATGLKWIVITPGVGSKPKADEMVQVRYAGWTKDGMCFDHTPGDETMSFNLNSVIPGWSEGLQDMRTGEKRRFWIPKNLAYDGADGKPAGMLVFDIELLSVGDEEPEAKPEAKPEPESPE